MNSSLIDANARLYPKTVRRPVREILSKRRAEEEYTNADREAVLVLAGLGSDNSLIEIRDMLKKRGTETAVLQFQVFRTSDKRQIVARELNEFDSQLEKDSTKRACGPVWSLEGILAKADRQGTGGQLRRLTKVAKDHGLGLHPWKDALMITPGTKKNLGLLSVWASPRDGKIQGYLWTGRFARHLGVPAKTDLREAGWKYWTKDDFARFVSQLNVYLKKVDRTNRED